MFTRGEFAKGLLGLIGVGAVEATAPPKEKSTDHGKMIVIFTELEGTPKNGSICYAIAYYEPSKAPVTHDGFRLNISRQKFFTSEGDFPLEEFRSRANVEYVTALANSFADSGMCGRTDVINVTLWYTDGETGHHFTCPFPKNYRKVEHV